MRTASKCAALGLISGGLGVACLVGPLVLWAGMGDAEAKRSPCPAEMAHVGAFCMDRWEAFVVEMLPRQKTKAHSPYVSVEGLKVQAISRARSVPQAYISGAEAQMACKNAGKRLCTEVEFEGACEGARKATWPYGESHQNGACNDHGKSPLDVIFADLGPQRYEPLAMNDPRLNQVKGTLARTGSHKRCHSGNGIYDLVGNLHEWTDDPSGTFRGGYYLDTHINGDGCHYRTSAHHFGYHDYSTGFRCCKNAR